MAKVKQSAKVKLAQKVVKRATELTKKELKKKEIKKVVTVVTYPEGLYQETLKKNYQKARKEIGLPKAAPKKKNKGKSTSKKKSTASKTSRKSSSKKKK